MKIKTSELQGAALDYAVALAAGETYRAETGYNCIGMEFEAHRYSTDWAQGGPIIEREINKVWRNLDGSYCAQIKFRAPYYSPTYDADIGRDAYLNKHGPSMLIAAMRCYVASKLGDEVEIPEELT